MRSCTALFVALVSHAALAQVTPSPVGNWKSSTIINRDWGTASTVMLTVSSIATDQKAAGTFKVYAASGGGFPNYCRDGPVAGSFDGSSLTMASPSSNLCAERLFELKYSGGDTMTGRYRGGTGEFAEVTFTRQP